MSAIFGIIDLNKSKTASTALATTAFSKCYEVYKIDRLETKTFDNGYIGCGIQYITAEAPYEILPIIDKANDIAFTADAIIDNRDLLLGELNITDPSTPDGTILYHAYLKWHEDCVKHIRGVFSFVVYDIKRNTVQLFSDHFACRCLFYHLRDGILYFSTLLYPLLQASGLKYELNERWLVDSITVRGPAIMVDEPIESSIKNVKKVMSGNYVTVTLDDVTYKRYYDPVKNIKIDRTMTDDKCRDLLIKTLTASIEDCIRTDSEVAIKLSGGLDSSSVAAIATSLLKKEGKYLHSFTSIPLEDSTHTRDRYHIDNESPAIMLQKELFVNLDPTFVDCKGLNILNQLDNINNVWELPSKSQQNAVWILEIMKQAYDTGCRVILSGSTGNCTVSAGDFPVYLYDMIKHGHFIKAYKTADHFLTKYNGNKRKFFKDFLNSYTRYHKNKLLFNRPDCYADCVTRKDIGEKYNTQKRFQYKVVGQPPFSSISRCRDTIYYVQAYAQIGEIDTKLSLDTGVIERDPLRNVEFINFLCSLPYEFFCNKEYDRRLVREFLDDYVPDKIRLDIAHRGRQSADNAYRISLDWDRYLPDIKETLYSDTSLRFLDKNRIDEFFEGLSKDTLIENEMNMRMIIDAYSFVKYVKKLEQFT